MFPFAPELEILTAVFEDPIERWTFSDLAAPYWRWYANFATGAFVVADGEEIPLLPGCGCLIPPETRFAARLDAPVPHLYLHFLVGEPLASLPAGAYAFRLSDGERAARDRLAGAFKARRIAGFAVQDSPADGSARIGGACDAAALAFGALARFAGRLPPPRSFDPRIERLVRIIDEARDRAPSNPDLAALIGMHPDAMIRLFRRETGETPARWSLRRRMERACVLLSHSDRTIKDIAAACGFPDRDYFTTAFARLRGKPPARWRAERVRGGGGASDILTAPLESI